MSCPSCSGFIPTSITELLAASHIDCPHCRLRLTINKGESARAMSLLAKVDAAEQRLNARSTFDGRG